MEKEIILIGALVAGAIALYMMSGAPPIEGVDASVSIDNIS